MAEVFIWDTDTTEAGNKGAEAQAPEVAGAGIEEHSHSRGDWFSGLDMAEFGSHVRDPKTFDNCVTSLNYRASLTYLDMVEEFYENPGIEPPIIFVEGPRIKYPLNTDGTSGSASMYAVKPKRFNGNTDTYISPSEIVPLAEAVGGYSPKSKTLLNPFDIVYPSGLQHAVLWWPDYTFNGVRFDKDKGGLANLKYIVQSPLWSELLPGPVLEEFNTYLYKEPKETIDACKKEVSVYLRDLHGSIRDKRDLFPTAWKVMLALQEKYKHSGIPNMTLLPTMQDHFFKVRPRVGIRTLFGHDRVSLDITLLLDQVAASEQLQLSRSYLKNKLAEIPVIQSSAISD